MPNQELFDRVLNCISEHQTEFDMRYWYTTDACGTHACLAGFTILELGYTPLMYTDSRGGSATYCVPPRGVQTQGLYHDEISYVAAKALELTATQRKLLFDSGPLNDETHAPTNVEELAMRWKAVTCDD